MLKKVPCANEPLSSYYLASVDQLSRSKIHNEWLYVGKCSIHSLWSLACLHLPLPPLGTHDSLEHDRFARAGSLGSDPIDTVVDHKHCSRGAASRNLQRFEGSSAGILFITMAIRHQPRHPCAFPFHRSSAILQDGGSSSQTWLA